MHKQEPLYKDVLFSTIGIPIIIIFMPGKMVFILKSLLTALMALGFHTNSTHDPTHV